MLEKIKNLFNPKAWVRDVLFSKVAAKAGKYATAAVVAILASPKVAEGLAKFQPLLDQAGINVKEAAIVFVTAAIGALLNWVKNGPLRSE